MRGGSLCVPVRCGDLKVYCCPMGNIMLQTPLRECNPVASGVSNSGAFGAQLASKGALLKNSAINQSPNVSFSSTLGTLCAAEAGYYLG